MVMLYDFADVAFRNHGIREELDVVNFRSGLGPDNLPFPDGNANTEFLTAFLRHRHFLARVENKISGRALVPIRSALSQIQKRLANQDKNPLSDFSQRRLTRLNQQFTALLGIGMSKSQQRMREDISSLIEQEHKQLATMHQNIMTVHIPLDLSEPSLLEIEAMMNTPLGGRRWTERMQSNFGESVQTMQRSLAESMGMGEGSKAAGRRLRRNVTDLTIGRSDMIARTEIQRVANQVALRIYDRNPRVIKGVRAVETLDGRTCLICAGLDGKVYRMREPKPVYPVHVYCRGFYAPVAMSVQEMHDAGIIDKAELPPGFAEKFDGRVPGRVDYPTWFKAQDTQFQRDVLGPTRFKLFKSGKVPVTKFARDLRTLRIDELPVDGLVPAPGGFTPQMTIPL